jgi:hypothetical protein
MAGSAAFEAACAELERVARMDRWAARGTLQLTLMDAGLETSNVSAAQLAVVVDRLLPRQLQSQKVIDPSAICASLRAALASVDEGDAKEGAEAVFSRLGG